MQKEKYHCMGLVRGRQARLLYVQKITTECPNMPTKCAAILEYFIAAFQERDIEMKDAPIFNPKKKYMRTPGPSILAKLALH